MRLLTFLEVQGNTAKLPFQVFVTASSVKFVVRSKQVCIEWWKQLSY
jgi:hypothetical protein